jgi:ribosome maturation factor RimP
MATLAEQISQLAEGALAAHGLKLVQARLSGGTASGKGKLTLDVMAEMPDGSSPILEVCIAASRTLSAQMDVADIITSPYTLEVGSAGLERPLITPADYTRFNGRQAKLTFVRPIPHPSAEGKKGGVLGSAIGIITEPTETGTSLVLKEGGATITVTYAQIHHANLTPSSAELADMMKQANIRQKAQAEAETEEFNEEINQEESR